MGTARRSNRDAVITHKVGKDREEVVLEVSNFNSVNVGIEQEIYVCVEEWGWNWGCLNGIWGGG